MNSVPPAQKTVQLNPQAGPSSALQAIRVTIRAAILAATQPKAFGRGFDVVSPARAGKAFRHCEWQRSNPASPFSRHCDCRVAPLLATTGINQRLLTSSLRMATKQSSVLLFEEAFAHACWIAASLRSSQ
jgi:hypothetical protein